MSEFDKQYQEVIFNIIKNGRSNKGQDVRAKYESDGAPAHTISLLNQDFTFDNGKEIPFLTQKKMPEKDPLVELLWIWLKKSNDVLELRKDGCKVWNQWMRPDGTIGKSYGWQLRNKKRKVIVTEKMIEMSKNEEIEAYLEEDAIGSFTLLDQVDYLIYTLKTNPSSRRIKTTLWCVEDLDDMALEPCVYDTAWQLWDGKLNLTVTIRSNDMALGNPYNVYQYAVLHRLIAQVTGHEVGLIHFDIHNAHIYDRHVSDLVEQVTSEMHEAPTLTINPEIKSFYHFSIEDIQLKDVKHGKKYQFEVAV